MTIKDDILDISRQSKIAPLTPWFARTLDAMIERKVYAPEHDLVLLGHSIVHQLTAYRVETGASTVVLGMSGGVDSALTAALYKAAGWRVIGYIMPIHQDQAETDRGLEACKALGIEHNVADLTNLYEEVLRTQAQFDNDLIGKATLKAVKIRQGNLRARTRMITLYNAASQHGGIVASTDNFSELVAGFWTLHGDVGDVAPIQSLLKSWEVPMLAKMYGVPEATWRAKPTDGLGVDAGDEAQLGATYLEWDLMTLAINDLVSELADTATGELRLYDAKSQKESKATHKTIADHIGITEHSYGTDEHALEVLASVLHRIRGSWFKRMNPVNARHPFANRYAMIERIDLALFRPDIVK